MFIPPPNPQVGQAAGSIAGGALLGLLDGPLPFGEIACFGLGGDI